MSEIDIRLVDGRVVCDARAASCRCRENAGHYPESPHRCDPRCGGAWRGSDGGDDFEVVAWPAGMGPGALLAGLLPLSVPGLGSDEEW